MSGGEQLRGKGASSIAVVVIIVVIAAVVAGGYFLLKGEGEESEGEEGAPSGLPLYPESSSDIPEEYQSALENLKERDNQLLLSEELEIAEYIVSGDAYYNIQHWYENHMTGWTKPPRYGYSYTNLGPLEIGELEHFVVDVYIKDNAQAAGVWIAKVYGMEDTIYVLATGPISAFEELHY